MAFDPNSLMLAPPSLRRPGLVPLPQGPLLLQPDQATLRRLQQLPPTQQQQQAPPMDADQLRAEQNAADQRAYGEEHPFASGLASGIEGLKGSGHGLAALAEGVLGNEAGARNSLHAMQANQAAAANYDTGSPAALGDIHGVGDAFTWAEHQLGAAVPTIAATVLPALVTGGFGGLAAGGLRSAGLRFAAKEAAEAALKNGVATEGESLAASATAKAAASNASRMALGQQVGQDAGAIAGGTLVSAGGTAANIDPNASDAELQSQSGKALVGALGEGTLLSVPGLALLHRYGLAGAAAKDLAKKLPKPLWRRMVAEGGKQAAIGGAIMPATVAANKIVHNWMTGEGLTKGLVSPEALTDYMNAAASGTLLGAAMGAPAGMRGGGKGGAALPSVGNRAKAWRMWQKLGMFQKDAGAKVKAGDEIPADGSAPRPDDLYAKNEEALRTPPPDAESPPADIGPAPEAGAPEAGAPEAGARKTTARKTTARKTTARKTTARKTVKKGDEVQLDADSGTWFHSKLEEVQRARSKWEEDTFGDIKPFDVNESPEGDVTIGTSSQVPGAKLFDRDAFKAMRASYKNPIEAMMATLVSPSETGADRTAVNAGIKATAKMFQHGFDGRTKADEEAVGDFLNRVDPSKQRELKQNLLTAGIMTAGQRKRLTLAPSAKKGTVAADEATTRPGSPDETNVIGTTGDTGTGGLEGNLAERTAASDADLATIPDGIWKRAVFTGDKSKQTSPPEENVTMTTQGGAPAHLNMRVAASALARTGEGADQLGTLPGARKAKAVLGVMGEAMQRGAKIDPAQVRAGLRVFPDDKGGPAGNGRLTPTEAAGIRRQLVDKPTTIRTHQNRALSAVESPDRPVARPQQDVRTQKAAAVDRAARGQSRQGSFAEDHAGARALGEGDFDMERPPDVGARAHAEVGTGDTMVSARTDSGTGSARSIQAKIDWANKKHDVASAVVKNRIAALRTRDMNRAADTAQKNADKVQATHDTRILALQEQLKGAVDRETGFKERGAKENPVNTDAGGDIGTVYKAARALKLKYDELPRRWTERETGAHDERLASIYGDALALKPKTPGERSARSSLLLAAKRVADGSDQLTKLLDAEDAGKLSGMEPEERQAARQEHIDTAEERAGFEQQAGSGEGIKRVAAKEEAPIPKTPNTVTAEVRAKNAAARAAKAERDELAGVQHSKLEEGDSIARPDTATDSVKATVNAARKNPLYKRIFKALSDAAKGKRDPVKTQAKLQGIVDGLAKAFGVPSLEVRTFEEGAKLTRKGMEQSLGLGALETKGTGENVHGVRIWLRSDLKPHEVVSTLTHEFGHHMVHELFDKLPDGHPIKDAVFQDFLKWIKSFKGTETARDLRASRAPFFGTLADVRLGGTTRPMTEVSANHARYLTSFDEFFADNVARALQGHGAVRGIVGNFYAKVAHAMALVHSLMKGHEFVEAPESFKDFVRSTYFNGDLTPPDVAARKAFEATLNLSGEVTPEKLAAASVAPNDGGGGGNGVRQPGGNGGGASTPADVVGTMHPKDRALIEKLITRRDVFEKILTEFPQLHDKLMQYDTQMETAANAAYALWSAGKLELTGEGRGPGIAGAMRRFADNIMKVFGLKTNAELGLRMFKELKSNTYLTEGGIGKKSIAQRTRASDIAALRERSDTAEGARRAGLNASIAVRRALNYGHELNDRVLQPLTSKVMRGLDQRMRETNNPALRKLGAMVNRMAGEQGEGETYIMGSHRMTGTLANEFDKLVGDMKPADEALLMRSAFANKPIVGRPELEAKRQVLYDFAKRMEDYVTKSGAPMGHIDNYVPIRLSPELVRSGEAKFRSILGDTTLDTHMRKYFAGQEMRAGLSKKAAAAKAAKMTHEDMVNAMFSMANHDAGSQVRDAALDVGRVQTPGGRSFNPRVMDFLRKANRPDLIEKMAEFQNPNLHEVYVPYIRSAVRRAEFFRRFVKEREVQNADGSVGTKKYSVIEELLDQAKDTGASPADLTLARNYIDAQLGIYGNPAGHPVIGKLLGGMDNLLGTKLADPSSRTWEHLSNAIVTYENVRVLGLGLLGNMIDPLGNWTRSSSITTAWSGYREAMSAAWAKGDTNYLRAHAEALGVVERIAMSESLSMAFNATGTPGTFSYKVNQALFKINGMAMMTDFARMAALASGHKFLLEHAQLKSPHSARYLADLGLKPSEITPDAQHPGYADASSPNVKRALFQFVDEAVVRPHAGHRPLWHADPGFKVMAQYRGFIFSFYDTIIKRMSNEVKHGNIAGVAPLAGYLAVSMAAEFTREMVQYGPAGNPNRKDWDLADNMWYGMRRTGALGPRADFFADARSEIAHSSVPIPYESLSGPAIGQVADLTKMAMGSNDVGTTLLHALPGESIYQGYFADHSHAVQSSAQTAPSNAAMN